MASKFLSLKARGMGLAIPLAQFSFALGDEIRISFDPRLDDDPESWRFTTMSVGRRHALAAGVRRAAADYVEISLTETTPLA